MGDYKFIIPLQMQILDTVTDTALNCKFSKASDKRYRLHRSLEYDYLTSRVRYSEIDISDDCVLFHKAASYCYLISSKFIISTLDNSSVVHEMKNNVLKSLKKKYKRYLNTGVTFYSI